MRTSLGQLNSISREEFVAICGPIFEHSPWIADRVVDQRPFSSVTQLHQAMCKIVSDATDDAKHALIQSHPDLVGRLAREGRLTAQSTAEQTAAGLSELSPVEAEAFDRYNARYRERFGFPFLICARENRKDAILAAFPHRLQNDRDIEITTALTEIFKIARLRLLDAVTES